MTAIEDVVVIIPAYNPDDKFIAFLKALKNAGYRHILVVDDGSKNETKKYFEEARNEYHCHVVTHSVNLGQGRAYKSGFNYYLEKSKPGGYYAGTIGLIQCDCDGQHKVEDVNKCADLLRKRPHSFILGVRDFSDKSIPFRSRFGNRCTTFVFKMFCGLDISDTQTGLKGIPAFFIPVLIEVSGERFEYASSVLLETKRCGVEIIQFPIQTIYINGNETSHFNPMRDSIRIYSLILKYLLSSLSAFVVDITAFGLLITITKDRLPFPYIIVSTYTAKIISCTYTYFINKKMVFQNHSRNMLTAAKFTILCIVQASFSAFLTNGLVGWMHWNEILSKVIIDILLFFVSFQIQNRWVFKNEAE